MHLSVAIYWPLESSIVSSAMEVSKYGNPSALCEKNFYTGRGQFSEHPCDQTSGHTGLGLTATTASPMAGYGCGHSIFLKMVMGAEF